MTVLFGRFYRVDKIDVDRLVAAVGSHMRRHIPVQRRWQQLVGCGEIFAEVGRVVNFSGADLPGIAELRRQAIVEPAEFEVAHVIDRSFIDVEANGDGAGGIVKLGFGLDRGRNKSAGSVKLLDVLQIIAQADGVGRLAGLGANHLLQRLRGKLVIARPFQALQLVLQAGIDRIGDIDDGLVARAVFIFGRRLLHDFRLRLAELGFQVVRARSRREEVAAGRAD